MNGSLWGIGVVLLGLVVSVGLHELGHFLPARRFGALVPEFAIGFGPALWRRRAGETEVVIRALPLGGYVRILGMFAPGRAGRRRTRRNGRATLAEEARLQSAEELPDGSEDRAFYRLSWWRKAIVMAAGPLVNLLLALGLLALAMAGIGSPVASLSLSGVAPSIDAESGSLASPAASAGLRAGDEIVAIGGTRIEDWAQFQAAIATSTGSVEVTYLREGEERSTTLDPVADARGVRVIGVVAGREYRRAGIGEILVSYTGLLAGTASAITSLPLAAWDLASGLVTGAERDGAGLMSIVGVGRIAAEVTGDSAELGVTGWREQLGILLALLASLNAALGVFNLIPLPPLDGGHIAGALFEGIRALYFRLRGQPDPGAVDTARLMPLTYAVAGLLLALTVLLVVADLVDPLTLR